MQLDRADACRHLAIHLDDEVGSLLDRARTTAATEPDNLNGEKT